MTKSSKLFATARILLYNAKLPLKAASFNMKSLFVIICVILSVVFECRAYQANDTAKTITSDGSYLDTSLAVGYVVAKNQPGWFLAVGAPGGTYVWNSELVIGMPNTFTIAGASTNNRPTIIFSSPT